MEDEEMAENKGMIITLVMGFAILIIGTIIAFVIVQNVSEIYENVDPDTANSSSQNILANKGTQTTLSPTGEGITSLSVTRHNRTRLDFDGDDDYVLSERYDTISFWYKNSTTEWIFIVNSSGTLYVNGSLGTPAIYPIYDDGSNMYISKIDAVTFFNGSIDDFRGYNNSIDSNLVNLTYLGGRL